MHLHILHVSFVLKFFNLSFSLWGSSLTKITIQEGIDYLTCFQVSTRLTVVVFYAVRLSSQLMTDCRLQTGWLLTEGRLCNCQTVNFGRKKHNYNA